MKSMMRGFGLVAGAALLLAACGGGGGGGGSGLNGANSVTGTVRSANGDPMPGATIYLPGTSVAASANRATRTVGKATAPDGTVCEDPPTTDQSLVTTCSNADGTFTLTTTGLTATQIVFLRGSLRMVQSLSCSADPCTLPSTSTSFGGGTTTWPRVAVITGQWDRMEDVLAKLADSDTTDTTNGGYGRVSATTGEFVYGSEYGTNLTIIQGTRTVTPEENVTSVTYDTWETYYNGTKPLVVSGAPVFDVIFINCGDFDAADTYQAALQGYVDAGGRIYVTDRAYDNVEQAFPQVMRFEGDPDDATIPGPMEAAKVGSGGLTVNATINVAAMKTWLGAVSVNNGASGPGNPESDCIGVTGYTPVASALNSDGTIPIGDFLGGWSRMISAHTGQSPTIWISSGAGVDFDGETNRPLTVSMDIGSNSGKVVYSSYHTAETCPTLGFWPQERVLQYLMFESF